MQDTLGVSGLPQACSAQGVESPGSLSVRCPLLPAPRLRGLCWRAGQGRQAGRQAELVHAWPWGRGDSVGTGSWYQGHGSRSSTSSKSECEGPRGPRCSQAAPPARSVSHAARDALPRPGGGVLRVAHGLVPWCPDWVSDQCGGLASRAGGRLAGRGSRDPGCGSLQQRGGKPPASGEGALASTSRLFPGCQG